MTSTEVSESAGLRVRDLHGTTRQATEQTRRHKPTNQTDPGASTTDGRAAGPSASIPIWRRPAVIGGAVLAGVVVAVVVIVMATGSDEVTAEAPTQAQVTVPPGEADPTPGLPAQIETPDPVADIEPTPDVPTQAETSVPVDTDPAVEPEQPNEPAVPEIEGGVTLPVPLYILLSDSSQYAVWALEDDLGTITYVLRSPVPTATDGSVLIELRNPDVVNLTDETSFAQSAIVSVRDAPVVRHAGELVFEGEQYSLDG